MTERTIVMTTAIGTIVNLSVEASAAIIANLSGHEAGEIARDLRGGITFHCDGSTFTPDVVAHLDITDRVVHPLAPVERAPFPAGRKS